MSVQRNLIKTMDYARLPIVLLQLHLVPEVVSVCVLTDLNATSHTG